MGWDEIDARWTDRDPDAEHDELLARQDRAREKTDALHVARQADPMRCFFTGRKVTGGKPPSYCWGQLQRAHLIPKQRIKREFPQGAVYATDGSGGEPSWIAFDSRMIFAAEGSPDKRRSLRLLQWDPRVWIPACHGHHGNLDSYVLRLERAELPAEVEEYAEEYGLGWSLDRDFGLREDVAA